VKPTEESFQLFEEADEVFLADAVFQNCSAHNAKKAKNVRLTAAHDRLAGAPTVHPGEGRVHSLRFADGAAICQAETNAALRGDIHDLAMIKYPSPAERGRALFHETLLVLTEVDGEMIPPHSCETFQEFIDRTYDETCFRYKYIRPYNHEMHKIAEQTNDEFFRVTAKFEQLRARSSQVGIMLSQASMMEQWLDQMEQQRAEMNRLQDSLHELQGANTRLQEVQPK